MITVSTNIERHLNCCSYVYETEFYVKQNVHNIVKYRDLSL